MLAAAGCAGVDRASVPRGVCSLAVLRSFRARMSTDAASLGGQGGLVIAAAVLAGLAVVWYSRQPRGDEPAHRHYDVRFLVVAEGERFRKNDESHALEWVPVGAIRSLTEEESVLRMARKWEARRDAIFRRP